MPQWSNELQRAPNNYFRRTLRLTIFSMDDDDSRPMKGDDGVHFLPKFQSDFQFGLLMMRSIRKGQVPNMTPLTIFRASPTRQTRRSFHQGEGPLSGGSSSCLPVMLDTFLPRLCCISRNRFLIGSQTELKHSIK